MDSFEEWLQSSPESIPSVVAKWATKLLELGASWDTFQQGDSAATIDDLVDGGIPRLSARDICRSMNEVLKRRSRPLIVLWDIENVGIPSQTSASLCVTRIKAAVAPYGEIKQFRAYADIGLGHIPEQKRSELHLSGCNLVDSTHNGRKEVTDKMIIVDSLEFAYTHPDGAALCFITGDVDYAYLLSKLQKPQWTTIVISTGSNSTVLHVNCSAKMRWETDVLQMPMPINQHQNDEVSSGGAFIPDATGLLGLPLSQPPSLPPSVPTSLSRSDKALLCSIIKEGSGIGDGLPGTRKSYVGQKLKESQPERFADRDVVKAFLAQSIEAGLVYETGDGAFKSLHIVPITAQSTKKLPLSIAEIPPKVFEMSKTLPFMIFIEVWNMPKGAEMPGFIQQAGSYLIIMLRTLEEAKRTIDNELQSKGRLITRDDLLAARQAPSKGFLSSNNSITDTEEKNIIALIFEQGDISLSNLKAVYKQKYGSDIQYSKNLRDYISFSSKLHIKRPGGDSSDWIVTSHLRPPPGFVTLRKETAAVVTRCSGCDLLTPGNEIFFGPTGEKQILCHECFASCWTPEAQEHAQNRVIALMKMMADHDDILPPRNIVRKVLLERFPSHCVSKVQADLWIDLSIKAGVISEVKHCDNKKNKLVTLGDFKRFADVPYPVGFDTADAESFVTNLLWDQGGVLSRRAVNDALRRKFPHMSHPMMRGLVMHNGISNGVFFVAKGACGQTVGLTFEDAKIALEKKENTSGNKTEEEIYSKDKLMPTKETFKAEPASQQDEESESALSLSSREAAVDDIHSTPECGNGVGDRTIFDKEKLKFEGEDLHYFNKEEGDSMKEDDDEEVDIERLIRKLAV